MPYVLAFVGQNANGILRWWTEHILRSFEQYGFQHRIVDLCDGGLSSLAEIMGEEPPAFCFSFQGFGSDLRVGGQNIWNQGAIPFISFLTDNPYHAPHLHTAEGPSIILLYGCRDFLATYRDVLGGTSLATIISDGSFGFPENRFADSVAWDARPYQAVFVKTRVDPGEFTREWDQMSRPLRSIAYATAEAVLAGADHPVHAVCGSVFRDVDIHYGEHRELLLYVCSTVDRYVRAIRAERMVRALLPHDALIVGEWQELDGPGVRARLLPAIPADQLDRLYASSKIVVSTSPTVRFGIHERIAAGLMAGAAVLSDTTPFISAAMSTSPGFIGLDIDAPEFDDRLSEAYAGTLADPAMPDRIRRSVADARQRFSMDAFAERLIELVQLNQQRRGLAGWRFPPRELNA